MSTTYETVKTGPDLRWRGRVLAAVLLPIGPLAVAVLRFVLPYETTDDSKEIVHEVAAHQSTQSAVVWLGFVASLTLVPAVLAAAKVARAQSPRLAATALALLVPAYLSIAWLASSDAAVLFSVRHGLSVADAADSYDSLHPVVLVAGVIFVVGHVLGTVLLGCALWRGDAVPRLVALAVIVSQPLHFVAAVILSSHGLDLFAWGLNAVGFAAIALVVLRMSDDEWAAA
jgi:hypothetical protein